MTPAAAQTFDAVPTPRQPVLADSVWTPTRPAWWADAACLGMGADEWFPSRADGRRGTPTETAHIRRLKAICSTCPAVEPCRDHGLRYEAHGVWGGLTVRERRRMRQQLGIVLETPGEGGG